MCRDDVCKRRLSYGVAVLVVVAIMSGGTLSGAVVTVGLELRDMADNVMLPGSILASGTDYKIFASVACSDPAGIAGGSVDVEIANPPADFRFNSFTMWPGAPGPIGPNGTLQLVPPEANDIGKATLIWTAGFAHPGPVEFFTIVATANADMEVGTPTDPVGIFAGPGVASFAITGGGLVDPADMEWGPAIRIVPEPASLSLLAFGGLLALRRRRKK